uniref:Mitochondrial fission factor n=1 Tax=Oncorhynchus tshawytscha TaxID=74940 RepID=A0A8C8JIZ8_ONCTS
YSANVSSQNSQKLRPSLHYDKYRLTDRRLSRVQVVKMSRRLAGLEKQNAERRQTELVLFSLLLSACLLNGWLWIRR